MKSHSFNKVKYDVDIGVRDGDCDPPKRVCDPSMHINLDPDGTRRFLETVVHEALHASHFSCSEERITQTAYDVSRFLWRLGFRLDNSR